MLLANGSEMIQAVVKALSVEYFTSVAKIFTHMSVCKRQTCYLSALGNQLLGETR